MKKEIVFILVLLLFTSVYAFEIEKVGIVKIPYSVRPPASFGPYGISVDEVNQNMKIHAGSDNSCWIVSLTQHAVITGTEKLDRGTEAEKYIYLGDLYLCINDTVLEVRSKEKRIINNSGRLKNGISFILKKGDGYIAYFVDNDGAPGAVDTDGKVYSSKEAMDYLKEYDPAKYEESSRRAAELHLAVDFEENDALIWGQTYYSTARILKSYWKPEKYLYPNLDNAIQYDLQGIGYEHNFRYHGEGSNITIVSPEGRHLAVILIDKNSKVLQTEKDGNYSGSMYAGFGGNIYFYIAGDAYTEVYRIRRTWGEPDLYAMAVNGYTDDSYGKYVKETLSKMSRADMRILRNTVYALYGCSFRSEDLKTYFGRQVWYKDEGKNAGEIKLQGERKQLVEMIQTAEKK